MDSCSSSSEGGSPPPSDVNQELMPNTEEPVKCSRCHRTYRTRISYERHLPTCSSEFILSTSESDSETRSSEGDNAKNSQEQSDIALKKEEPEVKAITPVVTVIKPPNPVTVQTKPKARATGTGRPRGRPPKARLAQELQQYKVQSNMICNNNVSMITQTQQSIQPTVIVQQVPSANMMPSFLDSFQQQTGQSLQYIATIDVHSNSFQKPQYLSNGLVPGTFQLQSSPDGYVGNCVMPGVQLTANQPTMLGTIIQQPTTAIQCNIMGQEQMVLNTTPLEMYQDQTGGMFLSAPQMYYGLETIVSNTVMSSSQVMSSNQFIPGMQGMVAASSYSATTTQVYQTNKIEPMMDMPASYVIVPNQSQLPINLPPQQQQSQNQIPNNWSFNNADAYVPNRESVQQPRPLIQKPKPCYLPKTPVVQPYRQYPSQGANNSNSQKSFPSVAHLSSFKSAKVANVPSPTLAVPVRKINPVLPMTKVVLPKPAEIKEKVELKKWPKTEEVKQVVVISKAKINPLSLPSEQRVKQNSDNNVSKSPIKVVLPKSMKKGFYKFTQQVLPQITTSDNNEENQNLKPCPPIAANEKTPLAETAQLNHSEKPVKKRWFPKERVRPQQKPPAPSNLIYQVQSPDGFTCTSTSVSEVWEKVFEAVQKARIQHKMSPLSRNPFGVNIAGLQMLGLSHNGLRYLVEQLPGVNRCINYKPRYHLLNRPTDEDETESIPIENLSGCCRSEQFIDRSPYDLFSWLASRHRKAPKLVTPTDESTTVVNRRATSLNLPMAMRFRHLKETSKEAVGVYRSHIHGRGLFCLRDIESGEMVVEYAGELIRSTLTDYREKLYDRKDIGCYMFRIDDQLVVDATMRGNAARFINHSCEPNCYSKVVDILGKKHILIFALRRIPQGEELTYDYKFPFEDVKIPCTCGSRRCRKHLN